MLRSSYSVIKALSLKKTRFNTKYNFLIKINKFFRNKKQYYTSVFLIFRSASQREAQHRSSQPVDASYDVASNIRYQYYLLRNFLRGRFRGTRIFIAIGHIIGVRKYHAAEIRKSCWQNVAGKCDVIMGSRQGKLETALQTKNSYITINFYIFIVTQGLTES